MQSCCFTGYRPHRLMSYYEDFSAEKLQKALGDQIAVLYAAGCRTFVSGMCLGVDMWAAAEVLALKERFADVRLVAAVPFKGQEERWSKADQQEYKRLLSHCDRVEILFERPTSKEATAGCYRRRNQWMVEHTDMVLAVYDMGTADLRSGTAATVRYARRLWRPIRHIHPQTLAIVDEIVERR